MKIKEYRGKYDLAHGRPVVFREMQLAKNYCKGKGLEIGAAAHNPFGLEGCQNMAPKSNKADFEFYKMAQVEMCGSYADVDIDSAVEDMPTKPEMWDYIIHSHVLEHLPNPLQAMDDWYYALKPEGVLFMIVPKRDALPEDAARDVTTIDELVAWYNDGLTIDTFDWEAIGMKKMGHASVWTLDLLIEVVEWCNNNLLHTWNILDTEETDSKVGNGHTIVLQRV